MQMNATEHPWLESDLLLVAKELVKDYYILIAFFTLSEGCIYEHRFVLSSSFGYEKFSLVTNPISEVQYAAVINDSNPNRIHETFSKRISGVEMGARIAITNMGTELDVEYLAILIDKNIVTKFVQSCDVDTIEYMEVKSSYN